jgi:hypothetical protein
MFQVGLEELGQHGQRALRRELFQSVEGSIVQIGMAQFA